MLIQNSFERLHGTGMGPHDLCFPAYSGQGTLDHFVGDRMGEHDQKIRRPDPVFHVRAGFAEHFGLTSVFSTDIRILSLHALISAKNHYTHKNLRFLFCQVLQLALRG